MNYGELRSHFLQILNRDDCTDELADRFISSGLRRIERLLRTPFQRVITTVTVDELFTGKIAIPADYLGLHELLLNDAHVPRITSSQTETFDGFSISQGSFVFSWTPNVGDEISIEYYAEFPQGIADGTTTGYTLILNDVVVYASLIFAATYYTDVRKADFKQDFGEMIQEVQLMADIDEMSGRGMAVTPYGGGNA